MLELIFGMIALVICFYVFMFILGLIGMAAPFVIAGILLVCLFFALKNYYKAMKQNMDFKRVTWEVGKDNEPAKRSYFFGPGYKQLWATVKQAIKDDIELLEDVNDYREDLSMEFETFGTIVVFILALIAWAGIIVFGIGSTLVVVAVHGGITLVSMIVIYIIFGIVWLADRIYLMAHKIKSDCGVCHASFLIPVFQCPNCGQMHRKLVPGPYGIFQHKCQCGETLPCTFFNGRSKLDAYCPNCDSLITASDTRSVILQLIGGSSSGKTVYLSAFFHEYFEKLNSNEKVKYTVTNENQSIFDELESYFQGERCEATYQLNSQMYPVVVESELMKVKRKFAIYDIGGEMFDGVKADNEYTQLQFKYCQGLIILIDPFSSIEFRMSAKAEGVEVDHYSTIDSEDVVVNFVNYMIKNGQLKVGQKVNTPISVLIAKSDLAPIKKRIGPVKISVEYKNNFESYTDIQDCTNSLCRNFLMDIGMDDVVNNLETYFSDIKYSSVSSMGHDYDGTPYEPYAVVESVEWMLEKSDNEFYKAVNGIVNEEK